MNASMSCELMLLGKLPSTIRTLKIKKNENEKTFSHKGYAQKNILYQGRKWLPKTGWASSNIVSTPMPPPGGAFYSAKNWVGNYPPCPSATYTPA